MKGPPSRGCPFLRSRRSSSGPWRAPITSRYGERPSGYWRKSGPSTIVTATCEEAPMTRLLLLAVLAALVPTGSAAFEPYPAKPVRLLIGFPPGAAMDSVARPFAAKLSNILGQPVVVETRLGAGGTISSAAVARAQADGYTLGMGANGDLVIAPQLSKVDYDSRASFTPISLVSREHGFVLLAHPSLAAGSVKDLVDLARAQPGRLHYGSPGVGIPHHIAMEWFKKAAAIDIVHVPFKGGGPMITDLLGGQIPLGMGGVTAAPL